MSNTGFFVELSTSSDDVTGSCTLITLRLPNGENQKIIVDCGSFLEPNTKDLNCNFHFDPKEILACVVTHAHIDHIGRLPLLIKMNYRNKIYATKVTGNIIPDSLDDNYRIMCRESKKGGVQTYSYDEVELVVKRLRKKNFNERIKITDNMEIIFLKNGHLFGAAMIYIRCSFDGHEDINLLFTGDYKEKNKFFKMPKSMPYRLQHKRINIISESTYGAADINTADDIFFSEITKAVKKRKKVLVPAFSLGRTQEVLLKIKEMQDQGHIPSNYKIYCDGKLGKKYLKLAREGKLGIEKNKYFLPRNFTLIGEKKDMSARDERKEVVSSDDLAIIVSSSGNGSYGPANFYLKQMLENSNSTVIFTGYCTEGTVGRKILDASKDDDVIAFGENFTKKANIAFTRQFSAHADSDELLGLFGKFENLGSVILTHGSSKSKKALARKITSELDLNPEKVEILESCEITRVDAWGLI